MGAEIAETDDGGPTTSSLHDLWRVWVTPTDRKRCTYVTRDERPLAATAGHAKVIRALGPPRPAPHHPQAWPSAMPAGRSPCTDVRCTQRKPPVAVTVAISIGPADAGPRELGGRGQRAEREPLHVDGGADAQHGEVDAVLQVHRVERDAVAALVEQRHHRVELVAHLVHGRPGGPSSSRSAPRDHAGDHVGLAPPARAAAVGGRGDLLDGAARQRDLHASPTPASS